MNIDHQFTLSEFIFVQFLLSSYLVLLLRVSFDESMQVSDVYYCGLVITVADVILSVSLLRNRRGLYRLRLFIVNAITVVVIFHVFVLIPDGFLEGLVFSWTDPISFSRTLLWLDVLVLVAFCAVAFFTRKIQQEWLYVGFSIVTYIALLCLDVIVLRGTIASV